MKRLECTVGDKRGYKGDCMRLSSSGRYVEYSAAMKSVSAARSELLAVIADHNRLVRELDVLLNGEQGAAKQASLCDIVAQLRHSPDAGKMVTDGWLLQDIPKSNAQDAERGWTLDPAFLGKIKNDVIKNSGFDTCDEVVENVILAVVKIVTPKVWKLPALNSHEQEALWRCVECFEDGQGYDVDDGMMKRLADIGAIAHRSGGYYYLTECGRSMLAAAPKLGG